MATSFTTKHSLKFSAVIYIFMFPRILRGKADDYIPEIGSQGAANGNLPQNGPYGYVPQAGGASGYVPQAGGASGYVPQTGNGGAYDPGELVSKALTCFHNNYVYSSCEQSYRLTESGNINVPPEYTDQYCRGSCFGETNHVLDCIDNILSHFLFYNRASIRDVRETIKTGCSYGPNRGNFNVEERIEARENSAPKASKSIITGMLLTVIYMGYIIL